jgi:hypothetical protein
LTKDRTLSGPDSPISALLRRLSLARSCCDMFREEPAISDLDWTFTPRRRSRERFAYQHLNRSSTQLSPRFDLPTPRSPGFGSHTGDSTHLYTSRLLTCALVAFASAPSITRISLAASMHSLVRSSKRMLERWQLLSYHGVAAVSFEEKILWRPNAPSPASFRLFAPPSLGCFSAFGHPTTALSVSRRI